MHDILCAHARQVMSLALSGQRTPALSLAEFEPEAGATGKIEEQAIAKPTQAAQLPATAHAKTTSRAGQEPADLKSDLKTGSGRRRGRVRTDGCEIESLAPSQPGLTLGELRAAVALWYPRVFARRELQELSRAPPHRAGRMRKAVAAQVKLMQLREPNETPQTRPCCHCHYTGSLCLLFVCGTNPARFKHCSLVHYSLSVWLAPFAMCSRRGLCAGTRAAFKQHDVDGDGELSARQLQRLLADVNGGEALTSKDVAFVLRLADVRALPPPPVPCPLPLVSCRGSRGPAIECRP